VKKFCIANEKFLYFIFTEPRYFMVTEYGVGAKNIAEKVVDFWILRSKTVRGPTKPGFCNKYKSGFAHRRGRGDSEKQLSGIASFTGFQTSFQ
jgi:hypothetical protein